MQGHIGLSVVIGRTAFDDCYFDLSQLRSGHKAVQLVKFERQLNFGDDDVQAAAERTSAIVEQWMRKFGHARLLR